MLVTNKFLVYFGYTLFFGSYILYIKTISSPLFGLAGEFTGSELIISNFQYNINDSIAEIVNNEEYFSVFILYIFTYVLPIGKLLICFLSLWQLSMLRYLNKRRIRKYEAWIKASKPLENLNFETNFTEKLAYVLCFKIKSIEIVRAISKYQFVDSFMAIILVSHMMDAFVVITILEGGYYFWSYCLCSLISAQLISLGQLPVTKNMLWHYTKTSYYLDTTKLNSESKHGKTLSYNWKFFFAYFCHAITSIIMMACFIYFFFSNMIMMKLYLLDNWNLAKATLSGLDLMKNISDSRYLLNGFFTYSVFIISLPIIHMLGYISLHSYIICKYIQHIAKFRQTPFDFNNYFSKTYGMVDSNILFGKKDNLNDMDLFLYENISSKKNLMKAIFLFDHIGDWAMIDVLCLALMAAWFTGNSLSSIRVEIPPPYVYNNFYMIFTYGFAGFATVRILASYNHRLMTHVEYDFEYYQNKFNICGLEAKQKANRKHDLYKVSIESINHPQISSTDKIKSFHDLKNVMINKQKNIGITSYVPLIKFILTLSSILIITTIVTLWLTIRIEFMETYSEFISLSEQFPKGRELINKAIEDMEIDPIIGNCNPSLWPKEYEDCRSNNCTIFPIASFNNYCCFQDQNLFSPGACDCNEVSSILDGVYLTHLLTMLSQEEDTSTPDTDDPQSYTKALQLSKWIYMFLPELYNFELYQFFNLNKIYSHTLDLKADKNGNMHIIAAISIPDFSYHIGTKSPFMGLGSTDNEEFTYYPVNKYEVIKPYEEFIIGIDLLMECDNNSDSGPISKIEIADLFIPYLPLSNTFHEEEYKSDFIVLECLVELLKLFIKPFLNNKLDPYFNSDKKIILVTDTYYSITEVINMLLNTNTEDGKFECPEPNPNGTSEFFKEIYEDAREVNCLFSSLEFLNRLKNTQLFEDTTALDLFEKLLGIDLESII